jgi:FixJ family two-component response regulator
MRRGPLAVRLDDGLGGSSMNLEKPMNKQEILKAIESFFGDKSRSAAETKDALEEIAECAGMYAESIPSADDDLA